MSIILSCLQKSHLRLLSLLLLLGLVAACKTVEVPEKEEYVSDYDYSDMQVDAIIAHRAAEKYLNLRYEHQLGGDPIFLPFVRLTDVEVDKQQEIIHVHFNPRFADYPIRPHTIALADSVIRSHLNSGMNHFDIRLYSMGLPANTLIPNYFQTDRGKIDFLRFPIGGEQRPVSHVRNLDAPWLATGGLQGRHIALWHSHGWYYHTREKRWEWQRPRLFNTTEDILPMSFTIPYIIPMLENAGAKVWVARERDIQEHMVIVDNDTPREGGRYSEAQNRSATTWRDGHTPGFNPASLPIHDDANPFQTGTLRHSVTDSFPSASATWTPEIPESGYYAVYISYSSSPEHTTDARYTVYHTGGSTTFAVNQQIGGGTWIYLGHFHFNSGLNPDKGAVELSNQSVRAGKIISADAVRFGGGTGVIEREGRTSGRARYLEGARYHLQFSGAPDTLVWRLNDYNDYTDDFQSRGEWVNFLRGTPFGPNRDRSVGLGIPVELSLSFHTDAGVTRNDSVIGTLSIYTMEDMDRNPLFPDGMSRLANRDFTDLMQTQIVDDIRALHDTTWVRRALRNARYSESMRPNVPSTLLELLSHQNFRDMQYALDPHFRFDVSRAIYKSMLRFLSVQHGFSYIVQPLPVTHMRAEMEGRNLRISWRARPDPLEPTADADSFVLYRRVGQSGFDNGHSVPDTTIVLDDLVPGIIYSFKVRAANAGGVSMPSEIISVMLPDIQNGDNPNPILVINGFTRVSAPAIVNEANFRGFARFLDAGVPDGYDIGFTGDQYNFDIYDDWVSDDRPGHGASHATHETRKIAGNTRDFAIIHGKSLRNAGYGFVTVSEAAVEDSLVSPSAYRKVNLILGNQRQIRHVNPFADSLNGLPYGIYSPGIRSFLSDVARNGGGIFVSGAHVGTDLIHRPQPDSLVGVFASEVLGYTHVTNHASSTGDVFPAPLVGFNPDGTPKVSSVNDGRRGTHTAAATNRAMITPDEFSFFTGTPLHFNTDYSSSIYRVDAPDAIAPSKPGGLILLRYKENEFSAAVGYRSAHRVVVFGFPFETITSQEDRDRIMKSVLKFLE